MGIWLHRCHAKRLLTPALGRAQNDESILVRTSARTGDMRSSLAEPTDAICIQFAYSGLTHHLVEDGPEVIAAGAFGRRCEHLPFWPPEEGSGSLDAGEV
jgi:hypothetical protein